MKYSKIEYPLKLYNEDNNIILRDFKNNLILETDFTENKFEEFKEFIKTINLCYEDYLDFGDLNFSWEYVIKKYSKNNISVIIIIDPIDAEESKLFVYLDDKELYNNIESSDKNCLDYNAYDEPGWWEVCFKFNNLINIDEDISKVIDEILNNIWYSYRNWED